MNSRSLGLLLVSAGTILLILTLTLTLHIAGLLYGVILGSSILLNVLGSGILMKFIADQKLANL
ncbi:MULTISPECIES: hypothetical protein [Priestia]|jgi:hypothetical protein|uniref:hypothetical protein n=1 Tax=Priestia TaxID=2800373 RepID=UPI001ED1BD0A|nr:MULTISPECIES: hypothetical protein [Priestia]MBY0095143.1 hypothetical protein [Priestia aryabhattai]MBY0105508.1 hypothetical protein [Priestia aryabhattai]MCM3308686.1 hypothetical protein [Priestia megaterium]